MGLVSWEDVVRVQVQVSGVLIRQRLQWENYADFALELPYLTLCRCEAQST
jgi:hypothetical protein